MVAAKKARTSEIFIFQKFWSLEQRENLILREFKMQEYLYLLENGIWGYGENKMHCGKENPSCPNFLAMRTSHAQGKWS